ncbi:peptidase domain-containing ABC transporter [Pyruvatibacter sp.]|uniref:peptidase domain-containing ABC transporter n=1 Tax=Pyruvatibacter sp. TaxID=1981328 RepID=UPI0032EB5EBC
MSAQTATSARLEDYLHGGGLSGFQPTSATGACLVPLLNALGWRGEARHLAEALPHFADSLDLSDLRMVLANLHYVTVPERTVLADLRPDLLPCLFAQDGKTAGLVLERDGDTLTVLDGVVGDVVKVKAGQTIGTAYYIRKSDETLREQERASQGNWLGSVIGKFKGVIWQALALTFVINMFAVIVPLFIMGVYDKVVATRSAETLAYFLGGVLLAVMADGALRLVRGQMLAYVGARLDMLIGAAAFQKLLHMPVSMTERAPIGSQIARLKQFETVREVFTGPLAAAALDLPFLIFFLATIFLIGGVIGFVPVALIIGFTILGLVTWPISKARVARLGEARTQRQAFLIEAIENQRVVRQSGNGLHWRTRFREMSADSAAAHHSVSHLGVVVQTISQSMMMAAGVATLAVGTLMVMEGMMTIGALIATMALVWRLLAPIQAAFLGLNRIEQVKQSLAQVNQLMKLQVERTPGQLTSFYRTFKGHIAFSRVSFRYTPRAEPALVGVDFVARPGEMIAITGSSGSGKSTILKICSALYMPQAGAVSIDGNDLRQLDKGDLRQSIGYVAQRTSLFHGTLAQNMRLAHPTASVDAINTALAEAGLSDFVASLPEGLETRMTDHFQRRMADGMKQRFALARAYVKNAPIYLMDEPANNLDDEGDDLLRAKLAQLKGKSTVLMVTQRPSHMKMADRVVVIDQGRVSLDGPPDEVLAELFGG